MSTGSWVNEDGTGIWVQDPAPAEAPQGATTDMGGVPTDFGLSEPTINGTTDAISVA